MAVYAIGDIQGCYGHFRRLLDKLEFDPKRDSLLLTGDVVNRGKHSLKVLRYIVKHEASIRMVLGNHEIHMLAASERGRFKRSSDTFGDILKAPDRSDLLHWLRRQPLAMHDPDLNVLLVHAAVHPFWTLQNCLDFSAEVRNVMLGPSYRTFLKKLYGNQPSRWRDDMKRWSRIRYIVNVFTRLRYMSANGKLNFSHTGPPGSQPKRLVPWFRFPSRVDMQPTIVFGHWSSLGIHDADGVLALDTGCCWGNRLSAARVDGRKYKITSVKCK